jgi:uncharacterized protein (UPF0332 family)
MTETDALIQKANRYIKIAQLLLEDGDFESAVSRVYYAMFYRAEAVLLTKKLSLSSHKGVISAFGKHFIKTGVFNKEMGKELNRAFEKRQLSDYEYTFVITAREAEQMLQRGAEFVDKINRWLNTISP